MIRLHKEPTRTALGRWRVSSRRRPIGHIETFWGHEEVRFGDGREFIMSSFRRVQLWRAYGLWSHSSPPCKAKKDALLWLMNYVGWEEIVALRKGGL